MVTCDHGTPDTVETPAGRMHRMVTCDQGTPDTVETPAGRMHRMLTCLIKLPGVVGIGEIGLDRTRTSHDAVDVMHKQMAVDIALKSLQPHLVLVVHCRGRHADDSDAIFRDMLNTLPCTAGDRYSCRDGQSPETQSRT
jgi:Tat protein secretion system quality control protein TatD with DNase activity